MKYFIVYTVVIRIPCKLYYYTVSHVHLCSVYCYHCTSLGSARVIPAVHNCAEWKMQRQFHWNKCFCPTCVSHYCTLFTSQVRLHSLVLKYQACTVKYTPKEDKQRTRYIHIIPTHIIQTLIPTYFKASGIPTMEVIV